MNATHTIPCLEEMEQLSDEELYRRKLGMNQAQISKTLSTIVMFQRNHMRHVNAMYPHRSSSSECYNLDDIYRTLTSILLASDMATPNDVKQFSNAELYKHKLRKMQLQVCKEITHIESLQEDCEFNSPEYYNLDAISSNLKTIAAYSNML